MSKLLSLIVLIGIFYLIIITPARNSVLQQITKMGTDETEDGLPASYQNTWYYCDENLPVTTRIEMLGVEITLAEPIHPEIKGLFDQQCVTKDGEAVSAAEMIGLQKYVGLTQEKLRFQTDMFLQLNLKYWGYLRTYVLTLNEVLVAETPEETQPEISELKLAGFYWIQMQIAKDPKQLGNENTWHYIAVMNYGKASFMLLPTGELIPVSISCPVKENIANDFWFNQVSSDNVPGYILDETVYCGGDDDAEAATDYLAVQGTSVTDDYAGMYVIHGWPKASD